MYNGIEAVIFDLDGTLIDSMWVWKQIDIDYLKERGFDLPDDLQCDVEGKSFTETALYFKERFNIPCAIEEIKKTWYDMANHYYTHKISLKKGARDFLRALKNNNFTLGIGTSNNQILTKQILKTHNILHYFDAITTSCEVPAGKPSPDVFLKSAEKLGVLPKQCIVFEDTLAGVIAAKRAGMTVVAIADEASLPNKEEIMSLSDDYITDFSSSFALMQNLMQ